MKHFFNDALQTIIINAMLAPFTNEAFILPDYKYNNMLVIRHTFEQEYHYILEP